MNENGQWIWYYSTRTGKLVETKYWAKIEYEEKEIYYKHFKKIKKLAGYSNEKSVRKRLYSNYVEPGEFYNGGIYFLEPNMELAIALFTEKLMRNIQIIEKSLFKLEEA